MLASVTWFRMVCYWYYQFVPCSGSYNCKYITRIIDTPLNGVICANAHMWIHISLSKKHRNKASVYRGVVSLPVVIKCIHLFYFLLLPRAYSITLPHSLSYSNYNYLMIISFHNFSPVLTDIWIWLHGLQKSKLLLSLLNLIEE